MWVEDMLRAAAGDDRDPVLAWRNHPDVRRASFTTHVIGAAEHRAWWRRMLTDPARALLVYEHDGVPAGVVTLHGLGPAGGAAAWGFYLDVAGLTARGQLLPAWLGLEAEVVAHAFDELGLDRLTGETLADNTQVLALHRRFGFAEAGRHTRLVDGVPREVVRTELRAGSRAHSPAAARAARSLT